jgi:bis(5'-nucleosidyl)-tetraphosphatase
VRDTALPPIRETSAGVIPYRVGPNGEPVYLLIHSARVRRPRARWEFPKGGIEPGETPRQAAGRELEEKTGIVSYRFREGFERDLFYTYIRGGRRRHKTVAYHLAEVLDDATLARSGEHDEDPAGRWHVWAPPRLVTAYLCHAGIRELFLEADAWLRRAPEKAPLISPRHPGPGTGGSPRDGAAFPVEAMALLEE